MQPHAEVAALLLADPSFDGSIDIDKIVAELSDDDVAAMLDPMLAQEQIERFNKFDRIFPDTGPLRRQLYVKHMEFFAAGATHQERLFMAGNRVGKTVAGSFEATSHSTGQYKDWWEGRRFPYPTNGWAAGDTNETTRDIIQKELFGEVAWKRGKKTFDGTGMIPAELIGPCTWKSGVANLADVVKIKHVSGGWSTIGLKSFDQGRRVFQGTAKDWIWLDEEPPESVYGECNIRLMTTRGLMMITFTPLLGQSDVVLSFTEAEDRAS